MFIAQLTDTHITVPTNHDGDCNTKLDALKKCVAAINKLATLPDAIIHTGDLAHNGSVEEYKITKSIMDTLQAPYFITKGNRDSIKPLIQEFSLQNIQRENQSFLQYSADILDYRLVAVDTSSKDSNLGMLDFDRLANLDKILAEEPNRSTLIFMHHPPVNLSQTEQHFYEYENSRMIKNFRDLMVRHPQVIAYFCGHIHRSFKSAINLAPLIVMPPLCKTLNREKNPKDLSPEVAFYLHSFSNNRLVETEAISVN